ncbi:MAG TPA: hypothetical protein VFI26_04940 [Lysobacter sp.]|nr:hypothetical protein [Lysobacter sp.]
MAILGAWLYAGHDENSSFVQMHLTDYSVGSESICGGAMTSITANNKEVVVSMGDCFMSFNSQGASQLIGGQSADTFVPGAVAHALP